MRALSEQELLNAWELGQCQTPPVRALILLASSCPEPSLDLIAGLGIGKRDSSLLTLRELTFGNVLPGLVSCPECSERLELDFEVDDLRSKSGSGSGSEISISHSGYDLKIRPVNTYDLQSIVRLKDVSRARDGLLRRCILKIQCQENDISFDQLPEDVINAVEEKLEELDPQADVRLALSCPSCSHKWEAPFDIGSFFWSEIDNWARHILREVHTLAEKYGWSESDILSLSPTRRRIYLEMT
jgi:uncharacterized protein (UPF0212 family)